MEHTLQYAAHLARQVGELLLANFDRHGARADWKADHTVVTEADFAADRLITQALKKEYPHDIVLSEELSPSLNEISQAVWVVDPLDGTTNFSLGLQFWGVSIARCVEGKPQLGVLYFPFLDELYTAQRGEGAHMDGERLQTKAPGDDQPAAIFSCCSRSHRRYLISLPLKTRILGSAAYDFCSVARGSAAMGFQATPKIWDVAAGWLVLEEAGGAVEVLQGPEPFPLKQDINYVEQSYPTLMAATPELAAQAREGIRPRERV